jgi:hypothetical protein
VKNYFSLSLAFAVPLLLAGAASAQDGVDQWTRVHEEIRGSLVYLEAEGFDEKGTPVTSSATGVIIHPRGIIVTVDHFLGQLSEAQEGSVTIQARVGSKFGTPVELRPVNHAGLGLDLTIFALPDTGVVYRAACLYAGEPLANRSEVGTSGFPAATDYLKKEGRIENLTGHPESPISWQTNLDINEGQSGSPVYTSNGEIVAIAQAEAKDTSGLAYVMPLRPVLSVISGFAECSRGGRPAPPQLTDEQQACIQAEYGSRISMAFSRGGAVRCPGGGCLFESSDCNHRSELLTYSSPVGYRIDSFNFEQTAANAANNGPIQDERDDQGIISLSILLSCQPSSRPGAGGGWSEGKFVGTVRHVSPRDLMAEVREFCEASPP